MWHRIGSSLHDARVTGSLAMNATSLDENNISFYMNLPALHLTPSSRFLMCFFLSFSNMFPDVGFTFTKSPEPFIAPLNDRVDFDCALDIPVELIRWRHGRKYIQQNRTLPSRSPTSNQLTIKLESESQLGDYQVVNYLPEWKKGLQSIDACMHTTIYPFRMITHF